MGSKSTTEQWPLSGLMKSFSSGYFEHNSDKITRSNGDHSRVFTMVHLVHFVLFLKRIIRDYTTFTNLSLNQ